MADDDLDALERQILDGIFTKTDAVLIAGARIGLSSLIQRLREAEAENKKKLFYVPPFLAAQFKTERDEALERLREAEAEGNYQEQYEIQARANLVLLSRNARLERVREAAKDASIALWSAASKIDYEDDSRLGRALTKLEALDAALAAVEEK